MKNRLVQRIHAAINDLGVVHAGTRVGVAVSGGADSVALLFLLLDLREELGLVLNVVHLNHKLRGRASDTDEKFVANLATKHGLPLYAERVDVQTVARQKKANVEDTARRERYALFERLVAQGQLDWVAVAQTADDQAETVLAHVLRGTGLTGLGGIHPIAGRVFRPLLAVRRVDLRAYLRAKKQTWREDATNRDTSKTRARIRRKLLPLLEKQFQPAVVEHLTTLADLAREDEAVLDALAQESGRALVRTFQDKTLIQIRDLFQLAKGTEEVRFAQNESTYNRALTKRIVRHIIQGLKQKAGELTASHVDKVLKLALHGANGKTLQLPGDIQVRREYDTLVFAASDGNEKTKNKESAIEFEHAIELGRTETAVPVPQLGCVFRFRVIDWPEKTGDTRHTGPALDRDALRAPLVLRNWRPGDKLHPIGHRNAHKLKRLLNKKRVGRWERDGWPVLTSGGVLAWARGFSVAAEFAANERTRAGVVIVEEPIS